MFRFFFYVCVVLIWYEKNELMVLAQQCPFASCTCNFDDDWTSVTYAECNKNTGIERGISNISTILSLKITSISIFPYQTFANLSIDYLTISYYSSETLPANLFDGLISLTSLALHIKVYIF